MTVQELVSLNPKEIRKNESLMRSYVELYEGAFSLKPNCAPCTFKKDFKKLQKYINQGGEISPQNQKQMATTNKKWKVLKRHNNQILSYKKKGRTYRSFGRLATDEFIDEFLKYSKIADRKKYFEALTATKPESTGKAEKTTKNETQEFEAQTEETKDVENSQNESQEADAPGEESASENIEEAEAAQEVKDALPRKPRGRKANK